MCRVSFIPKVPRGCLKITTHKYVSEESSKLFFHSFIDAPIFWLWRVSSRCHCVNRLLGKWSTQLMCWCYRPMWQLPKAELQTTDKHSFVLCKMPPPLATPPHWGNIFKMLKSLSVSSPLNDGSYSPVCLTDLCVFFNMTSLFQQS